MNDIPKTTTEMHGEPCGDQLQAIFSPWGMITGVMVAEGVIHAYFANGSVLLFAPVASYDVAQIETPPERLN